MVAMTLTAKWRNRKVNLAECGKEASVNTKKNIYGANAQTINGVEIKTRSAMIKGN